MLSLEYLQQGNFAIIFLSQQRISDYLNDDAQPIDPQSYAENLPVYQRANAGHIGGYKLLHRDQTGLLFIWRDFCRQYYPAGVCE